MKDNIIIMLSIAAAVALASVINNTTIYFWKLETEL
jgi:hypothetical protein